MSNSNIKEFGVEMLRHDGGRVYIGGRIHKGKICQGDKFTFRFKNIPVDPSNVYGPQRRYEEQPIDVRICTIFFYGKLVTELDSGCTAEVEIIGPDAGTVSQGEVLGT